LGEWWRRHSSAGFSFPQSSSWSRSFRERDFPIRVQSIRRRRETDMRASYVAITAGAILLAACKVGPNYKRPQVAVPPNFRAPNPLGGPQAASLANLKWFEVFHDQKLQDLIRIALVNNYDLLDAVTRIEQARANLGITRSD